MVSEGGLDVAVAVPRDVFREATQSGAAAVVLFHNHPSGDPEPSRDDLLLTRRLIHAGRIVGIDVVDHLILGDTEYCSLRLRKML
jgi:DNA repair protein RadC